MKFVIKMMLGALMLTAFCAISINLNDELLRKFSSLVYCIWTRSFKFEDIGKY